MPTQSVSRLWAITCLFNPIGFAIRTTNFKLFRHHLPMPLLAVELAFDQPFALEVSDADILVQVTGGSALWQKERLLNIGVNALPPECDQVVWIDADMIVRDPDWPQAVSRALESWPVVQPYSTVHHLDPTGSRIHPNRSTVSALSAGQSFNALFSTSLHRGAEAVSSGHIWAARREVLGPHGLYDACIVGGGDSAFLCAAFGKFDQVVAAHCMGPEQADRYVAWAERLYSDVHANIGVLPSEAEHLWHGELKNRRGRERHVALRSIGFDPFTDIALSTSCTWRWASDRPELHDFVREYFRSRSEDD